MASTIEKTQKRGEHKMKKCLLWLSILTIILSIGKNAFALPSGTWGLLFADEFSGTSVDTLKWTTQYPWGATHDSDSYALASNLNVSNGVLTETAKRESTGGYDFSGAAISTGYNKFTFTYGYAEARVKLPSKIGSWPSFWGLYTGWPPECDVMEYPIKTSGTNYNQTNIAYHYKTSSGGNSAYGSGLVDRGLGNLSSDWHTFGMEWTTGDIKFYIDGNWVDQVYDDSAIAQMAYMYLILDYKVGGWPGTPSTSQWASGASDTFQVDWVRVWQKTSNMVTNWSHDGDGNINWDTSGNWSNGVPDLSRHTAHFGQVSATNVRLDWNGLKTVGGLEFQGSVNYNIGWSSDSLMLHNSRDTRTYIDLLAGGSEGTNAISSRLELYDNTTIRNYMSTVFSLNGNIIGPGELRMESGKVVINGEGQYSGNTIVTNNADVTVANLIYNVDAANTGNIQISNGGILRVNNLDWGGSLKWLYYNANKLTFDNGTLVVQQNSTSNRGFTIQSGGAKIAIASGATVAINEGLSYESIVSSAGGNLTFDCAGTGVLGKNLPGTGGLIKMGSGMLTLNAPNTYSGNTTVNGGILEIAGGIGPSGTSLIDVQSGTAILKTVNVSKTNLNVDTAESAIFEVASGTHDIGIINGSGTTQVDGGATLTATSIVENTLIIGSGGTVVIRAIPGGLLGGEIAPVPEPSSLVILIGALILMMAARVKKFLR
jgi:autotransporter-associated beta strand protein